MVLSNKKLKQKQRAEKGDVLVSSEAQVHDSGINLSLSEAPNSSSKQSLKAADSAPQDLSLSKRRKKAPEENGGGDSKEEGTVKVVESKAVKRKREEEERMRALEVRRLLKRQKRENRRKNDSSLQENGAVEKAEVGADKAAEGEKGGQGNPALKKATKSKKKKIQKKKKKGKMNVDDAKGEQGFPSAGNVENASQNGTETASVNSTSISEVSVDVSTKVCVGGIPYYSTEDDIRSFFESCGTITEVDCMTFPDTGKFRGIAIMNFKTEAAAKRALALDGSDMGGFFLKIQPYKPARAEKAPKFSPIVVLEGYNRIYAGNLSYDITEEDLRSLLSGCNISSIRFGEDKETKEFRGYAHVDFSDSASLDLALKLDQRVVCGRPIRISRAVPPRGPITTNINEVRSVEKKKEADVPSGAEFVHSAVEVVPSSAAEDVPGKIRRRTCYECGDRGHLSSACPKMQAEAQAKAAEIVQRSSYTKETVPVPVAAEAVPAGKLRHRTCYECGERGHLSSACPKTQQAKAAEIVQRSSNTKETIPYAPKFVPYAVEAVPAPVAAEVVPAGKLRHRTCYECGERGHLSSACPKKQAEDQGKAKEKEAVVPYAVEAVPAPVAAEVLSAGKLRRRTCYECGERGHLSTACPKLQAGDAAAS